MNGLNKNFKIAFIIALILIPICIFLSFIYALKGQYYLKVNRKNEDYIVKMLEEDNDISKDKKIRKIGNMQGLGDWVLYLEYTDGSKEEDILNDGDLHELYMYIKQNGKLGGTKATIVHYTFMASVGIVILYFIYKICIHVNKKTDEIIKNNNKQV